MLAILLVASPVRSEPVKPIMLHPDNPHYFLFRGKPTVLITSGEHYGAVLNRDFDYVRYLDTLQAGGLNLTRTFSGIYREVPGSFGITENTLGPEPKSFLCPWARSGGQDGSGKFDLKNWDQAYFDRLKDFIAVAGKHGIIVELVLFCAIYDDKLWNVNPMKAGNNVQGAGNVGRLEVYTLKDKELTALQESLVRKLVTELNGYNNVYFEVCNEPYFGGVTREWTERMIAAIVDTEKALPQRHLIAQNIANGSAKIENPNSHVSIFNFHYAHPPDTVAVNFGLGRAIADDETGFRGKDDRHYRTEGWDFFLAGGSVYSNLDYSFTCRHPDGTTPVTTSPGGGGSELRRQLRILKEFMDSFDFIKMKPDNAVIKGGLATVAIAGNPPEARMTARALVEPGRAYAIYLKGGTQAELKLDLPAGAYSVEWVNTKTGKIDKREAINHPGGEKALSSPEYVEDIALRIKRSQ
jgi:hypothetical protein